MTLNLFNNGIHSLVRRWRRGLTFVVLASSATVAHGQSPKIPIRVVVVTTFEVGNDTGDRPGELQNWAGKFPLPDSLPLTDTYFGHLRYNPDLQVLAVVTGQGPQRTAATITALGQDPRFDLSHAYFVLAGIAGVDPNAGTVGSAFWASYVVDGSIGHEIDAREIPPDWPNGFTPVHHDHPNFQPVPDPNTMFGDNLFKLNPSLVAMGLREDERRQTPRQCRAASDTRAIHGIPGSAETAVGDERGRHCNPNLVDRRKDELVGRGLG